MIDIHNHIIYGVDDGSRSLDESMKMVEIYMENGFDSIIATSHYDRSRYMVSPDEIREKSSILNKECQKRGLDFKIYSGHEVQIEPNILDYFEKGMVQSLNNSRFILLELPFINKAIYAKDLIYKAQLEGYVPIIAHAERYAYSDISYIKEFIKLGALVQVNYSSMKSHKDLMEGLLKRNMVHILATDAHQSEWRSPKIGDYKEEIVDLVGDGKFEEISTTNPKRIINDEFISPNYKGIKDLDQKKPKRSIFNFWRRKWI